MAHCDDQETGVAGSFGAGGIVLVDCSSDIGEGLESKMSVCMVHCKLLGSSIVAWATRRSENECFVEGQMYSQLIQMRQGESESFFGFFFFLKYQ